MRIVAFFSAIAVIILLLAGCGHEKSNNSQVVNLVQLGGVSGNTEVEYHSAREI